jgi:cysteine synthase A
MAKIAQRLTDLIGNTPLLELKRIREKQGFQSRLIAKLEAFNPGRSVKDRIGMALIETAEKQIIINKTDMIIEPTS